MARRSFLEILALRGLLRDEVELADLGQPLDQPADVRAEHFVDFGAGCVGILDRVVKQRHGNRGVIELQVGEDAGDFEGMREIRIAIGALLRAMLLHGIHVGLVEQVLIRVRVITRDPLDQLVLAHHGAASKGCGNAASEACRAASLQYST